MSGRRAAIAGFVAALLIPIVASAAEPDPLGRVITARAMDQIELLGARIVKLQITVADGPGRRDTALVLDRPEVLVAQAWQRSAIDLGVAADIVVNAGVKNDSVIGAIKSSGLEITAFQMFFFAGFVALLIKDGVRTPVLGFLW